MTLGNLQNKFEPIHILYIISILITGVLFVMTKEEVFKICFVSLISFYFGKVGTKTKNGTE